MFVTLFTVGIIFSGRNYQVTTAIWLGPLFLTCIIFNVALCRIRSTIRAIRIADSNERLACIHFFNIVMYTILAFLTRIFEYKSNSFWPPGSPYPFDDMDKLYGYFLYRVPFGWCLLIQNSFQLYVDLFVLYIILRFTNENKGKSEDTIYDEIL